MGKNPISEQRQFLSVGSVCCFFVLVLISIHCMLLLMKIVNLQVECCGQLLLDVAASVMLEFVPGQCCTVLVPES